MSGGFGVYFTSVHSVREVHLTLPALGFARACTD